MPLNFLEAGRLLFTEKNGLLSLRIEGGDFYPGVEVYASTPLIHLYEMVSVRDRRHPELKEIGLIKSIQELTPASRSLVKKALEERYFIPHILKIIDIKDSYTTLVWEVLTNRGPVTILLRDAHEHIRALGSNTFILIDIDEGRYKIEDLRKLDKKSRGLFEKYYYQ